MMIYASSNQRDQFPDISLDLLISDHNEQALLVTIVFRNLAILIIKKDEVIS